MAASGEPDVASQEHRAGSQHPDRVIAVAAPPGRDADQRDGDLVADV
jgi:hypothetical protein